MIELDLIVTSYLINMAQAVGALLMLLICELVGARVFKIELEKAVNRVEENPIAFSLFTTGRFIGACMVIAAAWSI